MIVIQCTHCKRQLSIDDAFAGGVCRCQHCGTIQTVPAAGQAASQLDAPAARSLYQHSGNRAETGVTTGTGLDDLAGLVSSGLTSDRLTRGGRAGKPPNLAALWIGLGAVVLVGVIAAIFFATRPKDVPGTGGGTGGGGANPAGNPGPAGTPAPAVSSGPNFAGMKLDGETVIYVIDAGSASTDVFGLIADAVAKSVHSLTPEQKFEIIYWRARAAGEQDNRDHDYPQGLATYASADNVDSAAMTIRKDVNPFGQTEPNAAIEAALKQGPSVVVLITHKGDDLPPGWAAQVAAMPGAAGVKFDTVNAAGSPSRPMQDLAAKTGGTYLEASKDDLTKAAE
jgi:hypothetical protein